MMGPARFHYLQVVPSFCRAITTQSCPPAGYRDIVLTYENDISIDNINRLRNTYVAGIVFQGCKSGLLLGTENP